LKVLEVLGDPLVLVIPFVPEVLVDLPSLSDLLVLVALVGRFDLSILFVPEVLVVLRPPDPEVLVLLLVLVGLTSPPDPVDPVVLQGHSDPEVLVVLTNPSGLVLPVVLSSQFDPLGLFGLVVLVGRRNSLPDPEVPVGLLRLDCRHYPDCRSCLADPVDQKWTAMGLRLEVLACLGNRSGPSDQGYCCNSLSHTDGTCISLSLVLFLFLGSKSTRNEKET
jgi:hypothetical protein